MMKKKKTLAPSDDDLEEEDEDEDDNKPPRARAFIDRGRGVYANSRIKMQLEAGPRHPLVSHWSGKKGA